MVRGIRFEDEPLRSGRDENEPLAEVYGDGMKKLWLSALVYTNNNNIPGHGLETCTIGSKHFSSSILARSQRIVGEAFARVESGW